MKTREEEIKQQALNYAEKIDYNLWLDTEHPKSYAKMLVMATAEDNAKWADEHPKSPWRDAKKELPQLKQPVILKDWSGRNTYYESLSTGDLQYIKENPELWPYWMPIPELPKGGEL